MGQRGQDGGGGLHGAVVRPVPDDRPQVRGVLPDLHGPPLRQGGRRRLRQRRREGRDLGHADLPGLQGREEGGRDRGRQPREARGPDQGRPHQVRRPGGGPPPRPPRPPLCIFFVVTILFSPPRRNRTDAFPGGGLWEKKKKKKKKKKKS